MKSKAKQGTAPSIPPANRKKKVSDSASMDASVSLLKKNEFTLIIVGALALTALAFFFFFRSSGPAPRTAGLAITPSSPGTLETGSLERRLADLETQVTALASGPGNAGASDTPSGSAGSYNLPAERLKHMEQRLSRLEASIQIKLDSLIDRMGKTELALRTLKNRAAALSVKSGKKSGKKAVAGLTVKKKKKKISKKAPIFHTVKKGETLWRIAQTYKTSVAALRRLNKLSATAKIYPGTNILVR